jgi:electron transport complex protein RnfG
MAKDKSNGGDVKEYLSLGAKLVVITAVVAVIVAYVNVTTKDIIAKNNSVKPEDLAYVMQGADDIAAYTELPGEDSPIKEMYEAKAGGNTIGYVYKIQLMGYKDNIDLLLGINSEDGTVGAVKIMKQAETPGLGALIADSKYIDQYTGKATDEDFKVVKAVPANPNEIESISGATISSNAVASGVNEAVKHFKTEIKGEVVVEVPTEPTIENMLLDGDLMEEVPGEQKAFKVTKAGEATGYIVYGEGKGFYDTPIVVAVGFDAATKKITNIMVTEQKETPGLGTAITEEGFSQLFQGKDAQAQAIEVYSGASVSSEGAIKAINKAIVYFNEVIMK